MAMAAARPLCVWILGDAAYLNAFRYGLIFIALNSVFYFLQGQFRWQFDSFGYLLVSTVYAVGTLTGAITLGLLLTPAIDGVVLGQMMGAAIAVALGIFRLRSSFVAAVDWAKLQQMLVFSLPLVPAQLALFASLYGSRLILNAVATLEEVGLFGYASQIAGIAMLAVLGVQAALAPFIMAHHEQPETPALLARLLEGFSAVAICLCLGLGLFADEALAVVGNPSYTACTFLPPGSQSPRRLHGSYGSPF
jgi:O-antigen/teichoic acid export membrane protein